MQQVLSSDLWKKVQAAARLAPSRRVAIAFVTRDLVEFRTGDVRTGRTSEISWGRFQKLLKVARIPAALLASEAKGSDKAARSRRASPRST